MGHHPENCEKVLALLSDYLDFELPPDACHEIEKHLAGCPPCVEFAESLRRTVALCRAYEPGTLPGQLSDGARAELESAWRKMLAARKPGAAT